MKFKSFSKAAQAIAAVAVSILATQLLGTDARAAGIGIYPTEVKVPNAARGTEYFRTIGFWHSEIVDQVFEMRASGPAANWVEFVDAETRTTVIDSIVVPANDGNKSEGRVVVRARIPDDAANGDYPGVILVATSVFDPDAAEGDSSSSVAVGAEIMLNIAVTGEQTIAGQLVDAVTRDVELGAPVRIESSVLNSGNVEITPEFHVAITDGPDVIGEGVLTAGSIEPGQTSLLEPQFGTERMALGTYGIELTVSFAGVEFGKRTLEFEVLPIGTFTRQGVLDVIELAGPAQVGAVAKLNVVFRNTGQIDSKAVFLGEVQRDGVLVEAVQSAERVVSPGSSDRLEVFVNTAQPGEYIVTGKINFEGKETETKSITFSVTDAPAQPSTGDSTGPDSGSSVSPSDSNSPDPSSGETSDPSASDAGSQDSNPSGGEAPSLESPDGNGEPTQGITVPSTAIVVGGLVVVGALATFGAVGWTARKRKTLS